MWQSDDRLKTHTVGLPANSDLTVEDIPSRDPPFSLIHFLLVFTKPRKSHGDKHWMSSAWVMDSMCVWGHTSASSVSSGRRLPQSIIRWSTQIGYWHLVVPLMTSIKVSSARGVTLRVDRHVCARVNLFYFGPMHMVRWPSGLRRQTKDQHSVSATVGTNFHIWSLRGRGFESHSHHWFLLTSSI